jgi:hypothetical protein
MGNGIPMILASRVTLTRVRASGTPGRRSAHWTGGTEGDSATPHLEGPRQEEYVSSLLVAAVDAFVYYWCKASR